MDTTELETWARAHAPVGSVQAVQVLELLHEYRLIFEVLEWTQVEWKQQRKVILAMAERLAKQSELLRREEKQSS